MTYGELEAVEQGARMAEGNAVEIDDVPLTRKIGNLAISVVVLLLGGLVVLAVVLWRAQ